MDLCIFDIDGTLVDSVAVDNACYLQAFEEITGVRVVDTDWSRFTHVTDPGLFYELFLVHRGQSADNPTHTKFKSRFVRLIEEAAREAGAFAGIAGAVQFVEEFCPSRGIATAFATGGYGETARIKLAVAGFSTMRPLAHADPYLTREQIIRDAVEQAALKHGVEHFNRITSFGDGVWDAEVARRLGYRFVGVDLHGKGKLQSAGCDHVIRGLSKARDLV